MNIAICDDVAADAEKIRSYLLAHFKQSGFTGNIHMFESGEALLTNYYPGRFDVLFLDIYMGGITGVETAKRIRENDPNCLLVFMTISDSHMRDGFALRAASYIEKPLTPEKLEVAFTQCRNTFMKNARYIEISFARNGLKIPFPRIMYVEISGRSVFFHTDTDETLKTQMTMDEVEKQLDSPAFIRCHRSFIVNMNHVEGIQGNDLTMKNGQLVPIRINGRKEVVSALNAFLTRRLFEEV